MKFIMSFASDWEYEKEIEISSLEDLKKIADLYEHRLVVDFHPLYGDTPEITIYDDYIE